MNITKIISISFTTLMLLLSFEINAEIGPRIVGGVESAANTWPFMAALMEKDVEGEISINDSKYDAYLMDSSAHQNFTGELANCGLAFEVCENVNGKICLIERGESLFSEKSANCKAGGGIAAIIYNNLEPPFLGISHINMPVVSTSRANGLTLLDHINENISFATLDIPPTISFCGGTYIGGKWVVTAAHCVSDVRADTLVLNIGGHNLDTDQDNMFDVVDIAIHRLYNAEIPVPHHDIAILQLKTVPQGITPILLADNTLLDLAIQNKHEVTTIGRGLQSPQVYGQIPTLELRDPRLYEVNLNLTDDNTCNQTMINFLNNNKKEDEKTISLESKIITDTMLCAGHITGGTSSCFGDSGGPLILSLEEKNYLVGITSWGYGCAQPDIYGVYTRTPYFKDTIDMILNDQLQATFVSTAIQQSNDDESWFGSWSLPTTLLLLFVYYFIGVTRQYIRRH